MRDYFEKCFGYAESKLKSNDLLLANIHLENSDFCRFNHAKIRQLGSVLQTELSFKIVRQNRQCLITMQLSGDFLIDKLRIDRLWNEVDALIDGSTEDPYILYNEEIQNTENVAVDATPKTEDVLTTILQKANGTDFVGIFANGSIATGFANNLGQRNWYETRSFNLDWSLYHHADKAVKGSYAGYKWDETAFNTEFEHCRSQIEVMGKQAKKLKAREYDTYLAPGAVSEIFDILNWGGFSLKKIKTKQSSFCQLEEGKQFLSKSFHLYENTGEGIAPNFDSVGFIRPDKVVLVEGGQYKSSLTNARSAKEFNIEPNGANSHEMAQSLELSAGSLEKANILKELGTGLFVNNLWYLNYSDKHSCRLTGMTRFATLWVENGEIVAPVDVMRFDECFFDLFGAKLNGLTKERSMLLSNMTYDRRDTSSQHLPGALIKNFNLTY